MDFQAMSRWTVRSRNVFSIVPSSLNVTLLLWNTVCYQSKLRTENVHPTPCPIPATGTAWCYPFRSCYMQHTGKSHWKILSLCRQAQQHELTSWSWAKLPASMLGFDTLCFSMKLPESDGPADRDLNSYRTAHKQTWKKTVEGRSFERLRRVTSAVIPELWY